VLQKNKVANPKRRLSYPGNRNDPREQLCTRSKGQPYLASSEVTPERKKKVESIGYLKQKII